MCRLLASVKISIKTKRKTNPVVSSRSYEIERVGTRRQSYVLVSTEIRPVREELQEHVDHVRGLDENAVEYNGPVGELGHVATGLHRQPSDSQGGIFGIQTKTLVNTHTARALYSPLPPTPNFGLKKKPKSVVKGVKKWNEYTEETAGGDKNNGYWEPSLGDGVLTRNLGLDIIVVVTMVRITVENARF